MATLFFGGMFLFGQLRFERRNPKGLPLPPGPKGLPLVGNLFDFPINNQWLVYDEWQKTYGKHFIIDCPLLWISGHFRRYGVLQCPRPSLFGFGFPAKDNRPVREKVFKLLWQNAIAHVGWTVCIIFLHFTIFQTLLVCFRMKWDFAFPFLPYGAAWKKYRRTFQEFFHHNEVFKYQPIQKREVHAFLRRLLVTPDNFLQHIRQ